MRLVIDGAVRAYRRINTTEEYQEVSVERDGNRIEIWAFKDNLNLQFTIDELRAIMRLFDVPTENATQNG